MKQIMKKILSLSLSLAMILSLVYTPASAATIAQGTNDNTIYLSFKFTSDANGNNPISSVESGSKFFAFLNFAGNPTVYENTLIAYDILIGFDSTKMSEPAKGDRDTAPDWNPNRGTGVVKASWAASGGILGEEDEYGDRAIKPSGSLLRVRFTATQALTQEDLNSIKVLGSYEGDKTVLGDASDKQFTIVEAPAISIGAVSGDIYKDTTAEEIKDMIASFDYIDASGAANTYDSASPEWSDFTVELPSNGLVVGENTLVGSYNGCTSEFKVTVKKSIDKIEIAANPTKTTYTAFDTFDKAGMVVEAVYDDESTEDITNEVVVDTATKLVVSDTKWTVTYGKYTADVNITVNPYEVDAPSYRDNLAYTGAEQDAPINAGDEEYYTLGGDLKATSAGTYTTTATLNDKANTVWDTTKNATDLSIQWDIKKVSITAGMATFTKKYTAKYNQLPTTAELTGVNSEKVTADIEWYTDNSYATKASGEDAIAAIADITVGKTLYYIASGMDNYENYTGSVLVTIIDKEEAVIEWKTQPSGLTLDGKTATGTYTPDGYTIDKTMFAAKAKVGGQALTASEVQVMDGSATAIVPLGKITNVGTYVVKVTYEDNDYKGTDEFTVVIEPKSIEGYVVSLDIDGTEAETTAQAPLSVTYTGLEITPDVAGVAGLITGDFAVDAAVVGGTNVQADNYTVKVNGQGNYTGSTYGYWKITPAEIAPSGATVTSKQYNGNTEGAITAVTFTGLKNGETLEFGTDYTVSAATFADKNVANDIDVTATVALANTAKAKNYTLSSTAVSAKGNITKAAAPTLAASAVQTLLADSVVQGSKDYSFNLANIITGIPADAGNATYAVKTEGNFAKKNGEGIDGTSLNLTVATAQAADATDSVVVTVSTQNYEDADVTVNFLFKNKTTVEITLADITKEYGQDYTVQGSYAAQPADGYTWTYTYEGTNGTQYGPTTDAPKNAGTYTITANYEDNTPDTQNPSIPGHVGTTTAALTITAKALTVTAGDVVITKVYDETTTAGTITGTLGLTGVVGQDDVAVDMTAVEAGDYASAAVGTYTVELDGIALTGADKDNYTVNSIFNFENAKITKQLQAALTIDGADQNITKPYSKEAVEIVLGGGSGTGAFNLTSSDPTVVALSKVNDTTWSATFLKIGTVTITATKAADTNFEAATDLAIEYTVEPKTVTDADFTFDLENKEFTGEEIKPQVTSALNASTDYDVAYTANTNAGTATITVTAKGNYSGTVTKTFTITAKALNDTDFAFAGLAADGYTYTGSALTPGFDVKWGTKILSSTNDYEVAYADNTNAGTATITVTGKGNYSGTLTTTFAINPAAYTGVVTISASEATIAENTVLTANAPAGGTLAYQWKKNGEAIAEATGTTYTVQAADADAEITVAVTSTGNYEGTIESSAVVVGKTALTGTATLAGTSEITLTVEGAPAAENYDIVWLRNGEVIENANGTTYTVQDADKGCSITAKLVAKGDTYTGEITSNAVAVPATAPSFAEAPSVSAGNGQATVALSANANGSAITSYKIYVDGTLVATVDGSQTTYTVTGLTNGTEYKIKVEAINGIGSTQSGESTVTPKNPIGVGGSSGASSNKVTVSSDSKGAVKLSTSSARPGTKVKVTVNEVEGKEVKEVKILDKNGNEVELTENADGTLSFVMPKGGVTVEVEYEEAKDEPTDPEQPEEPEQPEQPVEPETPVASGQFKDVYDNTYYAAPVKWAVEKGITTGLSDDSFGPEADCTRGQMVTFLWRAAGSPEVEAAGAFADVEGGSYYEKAVAWAVANGITSGTSDSTFSPDALVTRAQTVTFLFRLAKAAAEAGESAFADVTADAYYGDAVAWAVANGITNGLAEDVFGPDASCVRGQIVTFLFRYFGE